MSTKKYKNKFDECPLTYALNLIGGKWRLPIIWALSENKIVRYNELKRKIEGITNMMLTESLRELEEYNVVNRKQYNQVPPKVEYSLTSKGQKLIPALKQLARWGEEMKETNE